LDDWERLDGPHFASLPSLSVNPMVPPGDPTVQRWFVGVGESSNLGSLTTLKTDTLLGESTIEEFARTPLLTRLKHLTIGVQTAGLLALSDYSEYGQLRCLRLICYSTTVLAFHRFMTSTAASGLRDLSVSVNDDDAGTPVIAVALASRSARRLRTLILESAISDGLIRALVTSPLTNLVRLGLSRHIAPCFLTRDGIAVLSNSTALPSLRELELLGHALDAATLSPLFTATGLPNLRDLDLSENNLGDDGAAVLANGSLAPQLRRLNLVYNRIGREGAMVLASAASLDRLHYLNLAGNDVGPNARQALLDRFGDRVVI